MVAYLKGVRQINEGKTERNIELIAANIGLEPELVKAACWYAVRSDGSISPESIINFQEWAVSKDYQDEVVPTETFWNSHFVDYANSILGAATE